METPKVVYYELRYSVNRERVKTFLTLSRVEAEMKTSEVTIGAESVHMEFFRRYDTFEIFQKELKKAAACL